MLVVLPTDRIGGAERVAMNLVEYLTGKNHIHVTIYFLTKNNSNSWAFFNELDNVDIIHQNSTRVAKSIFKLSTFLYGRSFDYVYSTQAHTNSMLCLFRRLRILSCRFLILRESSILSSRFNGLKGFLINIMYQPYGNQDLLICQTNLMKEKLISYRGLRISTNSKVIHNPINLKLIKPLSELEVNMNSGTAFNIVMVGRLVQIKNHKLVIQALSQIKHKFRLYIVGDGELKNELYELCRTSNLLEEIRFVGNVKNPYKYMANADLGIISSFSEGFPNVLIEMMVSGTKDIIITPCTGDLELIPDITVLEGFSIKEMQNIISRKLKKPECYSQSYKEFSKSRDIASYWSEINSSFLNEIK